MLYELLYGVVRSRDPARERERADRFVTGLVSLPFDDVAAEHTSRIRAELATSGTPIGPHDLLIAGIAGANGLTLVTLNAGEFGRVPALNVEDWGKMQETRCAALLINGVVVP